MTIEQQYYENDGFWDEQLFDTQHDRFKLIAGKIPQDARRVLDVGCGNGIFVHLLSSMKDRFDEVHATDRSAAALKRVRTAKTEASIDALPFKDRAFDIVTSLEVIEHLPVTIYEAGLAQICRIASRYVLLSVPNEEDLEATMVPCPSCSTYFNPDYHMRSYNAAVMRTLLEPHGFKQRDVFYMGPKKHYFLVSRFLERRPPMSTRTNPFSVPIPCPMCGFTLPPGAASVPVSAKASVSMPGPANENTRSGPGAGPVSLLKSILHTRTDYGWIASLYERL